MHARMTPQERVDFGRRLKTARLTLGLTQSELALRVGVSDGLVVSRWERGANTPSERAPWRLGEVLGYRMLAYVYGGPPEGTA